MKGKMIMGKINYQLTKPEDLTPETLYNIFETVDSNTGALLRFSTTDNREEIFAAINGAGDSITTVFDEVLGIKSILITSAEVPIDRNKPMQGNCSKPCCNFYTVDGRHFASISNGVVRAVKNLLACGLIPSADEPVWISFTQINTPRGVAHTFELMDDPTEYIEGVVNND